MTTILGAAGQSPLVLIIIFWVLLILWALGTVTRGSEPNWPRTSTALLIIELAILGYCLFGFGF